eukprot:TRINITY_DN6245_c0_g4_i1.p1 TRINITY_DN6245_c0_g4~~TRINITY_DN6245_c0_g4_i1.p1  ORF type:complete len:423 (+),score=121.97 TRINITY_DN6245_c0_g4_i1:83-1351(+)
MMAADDRVYLDYNASTPVSRAAREAMAEAAASHYGNPSSAKESVESSRQKVAEALGCAPDEVIFTSGGTESNNLAICGALTALWDQKGMSHNTGHIITTDIEHPTTREVCWMLGVRGVQVSWLPTGSGGAVQAADVLAAVREDTLLVTMMHANNETGLLQPIAQIAEGLRAIREGRGGMTPVFHTDASQSLGKVPCKVEELGVDLLTVCSHKFHGPIGIGALYHRGGVPLCRQLFGAQHERGLRPGTENVILAAGMAAALAEAVRGLGDSSAHCAAVRRALYDALSAEVDVVQSGGADQAEGRRLPNTLSCALRQRGGGPYIQAVPLLVALADTVAASTGSACGLTMVSSVLQAMGMPWDQALGTLHLSVGRTTTPEAAQRGAALILAEAQRQFARKHPQSEVLHRSVDSSRQRPLQGPAHE